MSNHPRHGRSARPATQPPASILYLASASPRRSEILRQIGVPHDVLHVPSPPGEDEPHLAGESPDDYVRRTALEKAERAQQWLLAKNMHIADHTAHSHILDMRADNNDVDHAPHREELRPVLTADTTVALEGHILGKPQDVQEAASMLNSLSGRTHRVLTAVVLAHQGRLYQACSISQVRFRNLSQAEIQDYCRSGEPMGKAGAYGIQGRAAIFIAHLTGSYTGVMGLPACETWQLFTEAGLELSSTLAPRTYT